MASSNGGCRDAARVSRPAVGIANCMDAGLYRRGPVAILHGFRARRVRKRAAACPRLSGTTSSCSRLCRGAARALQRLACPASTIRGAAAGSRRSNGRSKLLCCGARARFRVHRRRPDRRRGSLGHGDPRHGGRGFDPRGQGRHRGRPSHVHGGRRRAAPDAAAGHGRRALSEARVRAEFGRADRGSRQGRRRNRDQVPAADPDRPLCPQGRRYGRWPSRFARVRGTRHGCPRPATACGSTGWSSTTNPCCGCPGSPGSRRLPSQGLMRQGSRGLPALIQCLSCRSVRWPLSRAMRTSVVRMWAGSRPPA